MNDKKKACLTCVYWHPNKYEIYYKYVDLGLTLKEIIEKYSSFMGSCHRFPCAAGSSFPFTYESCECGEWKKTKEVRR